MINFNPSTHASKLETDAELPQSPSMPSKKYQKTLRFQTTGTSKKFYNLITKHNNKPNSPKRNLTGSANHQDYMRNAALEDAQAVAKILSSTSKTPDFDSLLPSNIPANPLQTSDALNLAANDYSQIFDSPTKPTKKYSLTTRPEKPQRGEKKQKLETIFENPIKAIPLQKSIQFERLASTQRMYRSPNDKGHFLIEQRRSKSCGATALLMLYTSAIQVLGPFSEENAPSYSFWDWYSSCHLAHYDEITSVGNQSTPLATFGLKLESAFLNKHNKEDSLKFLIDKLHETERPVIFSITHQEIDGHWIVVDQFHNGHFYVRDPYTAKAYKVSLKEMEKHVDSRMEKCIFFSGSEKKTAMNS